MKPLRLVLIAMVVLFVAVLLPYVYRTSYTAAKVCGDNACNGGEDCSECPQDCACKNGAICSDGECSIPICGDGVCSGGESDVDCCDDCGCYESGRVCNEATHTCDFPEAQIADADAIGAVSAYYAAQNLTTSSIKVTGPSVSSGKPVKVVLVFLQGDPYERLLAVDAGGNIVEELVRW